MLDEAGKRKKLELLKKKRELEKVNKLRAYDPYPFQVEFHNDPDSRKCLRAGNQLGKTVAGCSQDAMHLTGRYPDWYQGHRFNHPVELVCGGVNNDKTRDLLQKALFGDPVIWRESLGTGWIPKDCIGEISLKRGVSDAFMHVKVKHGSGGWSTVTFLAYEMGKMSWMGSTTDVYHLDEEPPIDILGQAGRGCIASGGHIYLTFTPEQGQTEVVNKVSKEWSLHTAEWSDVSGEDFEYELIDGEQKETIVFKTIKTMKGRPGHVHRKTLEMAEKDYPPYEMKMRIKGIPVIGEGRVFGYDESTIKVSPLDGGIPASWKRIAAVDFGGMAKKSHPTAVVYLAYDEDNDVAYVYDGFRLYSAEIADVAARMNARPSWIPVVWPHDGNKEVPGGSTVAQEYANYGVNMMDRHFTNPPKDGDREGSGGIKIEPGIVVMGNRIKDRRLRTYGTFPEWFEEYRNYHLKGGKIVDREDDLMAATRYACMSLRHAVTEKDVIEDDEWEDDFEDKHRNAYTGY